MKKVIETIKDNIKNKRAIFVFPSEIVSNFWRRLIIKQLDLKLIYINQFISWDKFKSTCILYQEGKQPVNNRERLLFLNHLLNRNMLQSFFKAIISPAYAEHSPVFIRKFMEILPFLHNLECIEKISGNDVFDTVKLQDLVLLKKSYLTFLEANLLYEPAYHTPQFKPGNSHYYLFFPEILNDYNQFKPLFMENPEISQIHLNDLDRQDNKPGINIFENSLFEIQSVLDSIEQLLDRGIKPENISITVANLTELEEYLITSAQIRSIPLYIHSGRPITSYKEILFLNQITECYQSRFSINQVKKFVLNHSLPWKNQRIARNLVAFGIRYSCLQEKNSEDKWLLNFQKASVIKKNTPGNKNSSDTKNEFSHYLDAMERFYTKLKFHITALFRSKDFTALHKQLRKFGNAFFKKELWTDEKYRVFQYSLNLLNELEIVTRNLAGVEVINPYLTWLHYLEDKQYVKETFSNKIPVYPYRVSAGIFTDYHFLLNITQKGTKYIIRNFPFLSINEETFMETPETDLSELYLKLYVHSGSNVTFSFSKRSFQDSNIIPGYFISDGVIANMAESGNTGDLYRKEKALWAGEQPAFNRFYLMQKNSFCRAYSTFFVNKSGNFTKQSISGRSLQLLLEKRLKKENILRISPSGLEQYIRCPFAYLLDKGMKLNDRDYSVTMIDHRSIGSIMHKIFEEFYTGLNALANSVIDPGKKDFYTELMQLSSAKTLESYEKESPVPVSACWDYIKKKTINYGLSFVEAEMETFKGFKTTGTEQEIDVNSAVSGIQLYGKVDRISEDMDGIAIIDYKKKEYPTRNDIFSDKPVSFQMPFYIYLLEENRKKQVKLAAYFIYELGQYHYVISPSGKVMATREELDEAIVHMQQRINEMADSILKGIFTVSHSADTDTCRFCDYRTVCRIKFLIG